MADKTGFLKMTILNASETLSALKFRGWLRGEAEDIQANTHENDLIIIRFYMPDNLRLLMPQRKIDDILQGITNKFYNIQTIELIAVRNSLNEMEMAAATEVGKEDLAEMAKEISEI